MIRVLAAIVIAALAVVAFLAISSRDGDQVAVNKVPNASVFGDATSLQESPQASSTRRADPRDKAINELVAQALTGEEKSVAALYGKLSRCEGLNDRPGRDSVLLSLMESRESASAAALRTLRSRAIHECVSIPQHLVDRIDEVLIVAAESGNADAAAILLSRYSYLRPSSGRNVFAAELDRRAQQLAVDLNDRLAREGSFDAAYSLAAVISSGGVSALGAADASRYAHLAILLAEGQPPTLKLSAYSVFERASRMLSEEELQSARAEAAQMYDACCKS
jgi:hypothetical protein